MSEIDTIVIGLDGANWRLLDQWIESGDLPTIEKLKQEGVWGKNRSWLPPSTFPNWKCYATGKNPGKFGVYWFESIDTNKSQITVPDARSFKSPELWDYLNDGGERTGVLNMPTTYPPKSLDGCVVSGGPRSGDSGYTTPESLEADIKQDLGYRVHPRKAPINRNDNNAEAIEELHDVVKLRFDLLEYVIEKKDLDFVHMTVFYINVLQHFFGDAESVKQGWKLIDDRLATLRESCENLIIMSDHGTGDIHTVFWINTWLEKEGYLTRRTDSVDKAFSRIGKHRDSVLSVARSLGLESLIRQVVPEWLQMRIQPGGVYQKQSKGQLIDWTETKAIASGQGPIYLNRSILNEDEYESLREELQQKLSSVESPISGESIAEDIHRGEDIYEGPYSEARPDLVVEQRNGVHIDGGVGREQIFEGPTKWQAENYRTGLFVFDSNQFDSTNDGNTIDMVDLAPTILHLMGKAVPNDMDGRVLTELFAEGSEAASREITYRDPLDSAADVQTFEDQEFAKNRLEELGYLS